MLWNDFHWETIAGESPSSRTGLLPSSPLRTVRESFQSHSSGPANAFLKETRLRDGNTLAMNPVVALRMKENAVFGALRTTHHGAREVAPRSLEEPSTSFGVMQLNNGAIGLAAST
jgi:hypothetical protein